jgi:hypothetical protein
MPPLPGWARGPALAASWGAIALAAAMCVLGLAPGITGADMRPAWLLVGFNLLVAGAGVLGVLTARGRFAEGPALALVCVAGTIAVASVLGAVSVGGRRMGWLNLMLPALASVGLGGVMAAVGGLAVLARRAGALRTFAIGAALGAPVVVVAGAVAFTRGGVLDFMSGWHAAVKLVAAILSLTVLGTLFCISAHMVIRAFDMGREPGRA